MKTCCLPPMLHRLQLHRRRRQSWRERQSRWGCLPPAAYSSEGPEPLPPPPLSQRGPLCPGGWLVACASWPRREAAAWMPGLEAVARRLSSGSAPLTAVTAGLQPCFPTSPAMARACVNFASSCFYRRRQHRLLSSTLSSLHVCVGGEMKGPGRSECMVATKYKIRGA